MRKDTSRLNGRLLAYVSGTQILFFFVKVWYSIRDLGAKQAVVHPQYQIENGSDFRNYGT